MTHLDILELSLIALLAFYVLRITRTLDLRQELTSTKLALSQTASELRARHEELGRDLSRAPTQADHHQVLTKLARMEAGQESMARELQAARASQARVEDFLLKMGSRKGHDSQF